MKINCVDESFAIRNQIEFIPTNCKAVAAGANKMKLAGQTVEDVQLSVQNIETQLYWNLGKAIVVTNLGADIIMGEPGKADNRITTIPHRKVVLFMDESNHKYQLPYYANKQHPASFSTCRATKSETLYPHDSLAFKLPIELGSVSHVQIAPKRSNLHTWIKPSILKVQDDNTVNICNDTDEMITLSERSI